MSWESIPVTIKEQIKYKSAIEAIYKNQVDEGHRFFRNAPQKTDREKDETLSPKELAIQTAWIVMKSSIILLAQCVSSMDDIIKDMGENTSNITDEHKDQINSVIEDLQKINKALLAVELQKMRDLTGSEIAVNKVEYDVTDKLFVSVVNALPIKYLMKWIIFTVNINIIPFKYEMNKLIEV